MRKNGGVSAIRSSVRNLWFLAEICFPMSVWRGIDRLLMCGKVFFVASFYYYIRASVIDDARADLSCRCGAQAQPGIRYCPQILRATEILLIPTRRIGKTPPLVYGRKYLCLRVKPCDGKFDTLKNAISANKIEHLEKAWPTGHPANR